MNGQRKHEPLSDRDGVRDILNRIAIFAGLDDQQLALIFTVLEEVAYSKDEIIFKQGEPCSHIHIIKSGKIRLYIEDGNNILELAELDVGDCFGESSLIGIAPHTASAVAKETTEIIVLSSRALLSLYRQDKEAYIIIILNIAREIARRLSKTDNTLMHYIVDNRKS